MPSLNIKVTNPEALELIRKIKSGEIFLPVKNWLTKSKWYLISFAVVVVLLVALTIGQKLSEKTPVPVFVPPDIETLSPTETAIIKSGYSVIKDEIQNLNTDLPDPFIPVFDNNLNLEESTR